MASSLILDHASPPGFCAVFGPQSHRVCSALVHVQIPNVSGQTGTTRMDTKLGLISVLVAIIGWGSYFVPMKRIQKYDPYFFQFVMCIAIFVSSVLVSFFSKNIVYSYFGILSGILWATGNLLSIFAVQNSGLSKAAPLWMGGAIFISFIWGLFFFKEDLNPCLALVGVVVLVLGIFLISLINEDEGKSNFKGIICAIISGVFFGSQLVPLKMSGLEPMKFLFSMSLGIMVAGMMIYLVKRKSFEVQIFVPAIISGCLWNVANLASFFAVFNLGISVGYPLTQMALFVSLLWGIIYFKEITETRKIALLTYGAIILFIGSIILTFSR